MNASIILIFLSTINLIDRSSALQTKLAIEYAPCKIEIWSTTKYETADEYPSLFPVIQNDKDGKSKFRLPNLITEKHKLIVMLKDGEKLRFICRKKHNIMTLNADQGPVVECRNGTFDPFEMKNLACQTDAAKPILRMLEDQNCGEGKKWYEIGYEVYPLFSRDQAYIKGQVGLSNKKLKDKTTNVYFPFIGLCVDMETKLASYTMHYIDGNGIAGRQQLREISNTFSSDGYPSEMNFDVTYEPEIQYRHFANKLENYTADYFDNEYNYFLPRQLVPDYDMMLKNWKSATHFFLNTAPQWRTISCTWYTLEELIREQASRLQKDVIVFTGTYGVLELNQVQIHMPHSKIPVPRYFWKVIVSTMTDGEYMAIGFVTSNNPYEDDDTKPFCTSICGETQWMIEVTSPGLGKTICCEVEELLNNLDIELEIETDEITNNGDAKILKVKEIEQPFTVY